VGQVSVTSGAVVATSGGKVRGFERDGVHAFLGIPYAAPPFGARRLRPPEPHEAWDGVRDATEYGPTVPKGPYPPPYDRLLPEPVIPGEDCLNLNVWTPDPSSAAALPVLVWIHGGAFVNGSGAVPQYEGRTFARDGVVCVTINYRLGADGFLFTGEGIANCGLQDQVAALEWVQENIAAFGGDPARVTIAGESAGAMSVFSLLALPSARGLFGRAVSQSGSPKAVLPPEVSTRVAQSLAGRLGVEPTREAIAAVPIAELVEAQMLMGVEFQLGPDPERYGADAANHLPFEPSVDGEILPQVPLDAIAGGASADVTLLAGWNAEEHRLFLGPTGIAALADDTMVAFIAARYGLDPEAAVAVYREQAPDATPGELLIALGTDFLFRVPTIRAAEARFGAAAPTFLYEFAWRTPVEELGACHALEIPFVFDALGTTGEAIAGADAPQSVADVVHRAWVDFIAGGEPGWLPFTPERRVVMRFDAESGPAEDPAATELAVWP
jgi:para-nitrobenzyl esterase